MTTYRLVGYSQTREMGRVRVYVAADTAMRGYSPVFVARTTAPFDYAGQPLQLRRAPSALAARVRAHLLDRSVPAHCEAVPFQPVPEA